MLATQIKKLSEQPKQIVQPKQIIQPTVVNNYNIIQPTNDSIIVEHDKIKHEFIFKNNLNQLIGTFNIYQLFKFLNNDIDNYLVDIVLDTSDIIISKYIYDPTKDINKEYELISHTESAFTGNIELIVKLYSDIIKIEGDLLEKMIELPKEILEKIKTTNNKFIYNLLLRILKMSNTLLTQPDIDTSKKDILLRYSIGATHKLSTITKEELEIKYLQYNELENDINKIIKIQNVLENKLDSLKQLIDTQKINIDNLQIHDHKGGAKSTNSSNSSNSTKSTNSHSTKSTKSNSTNFSNHENLTDSFKTIPSLTNLSNPYNLDSISILSDSSIKYTNTISEKSNSNKTKSLIQTYNFDSSIIESEKTLTD